MILLISILTLISFLPSGGAVPPPGTAGVPDFESIAIHTDRDIYIAGERLYFRIDIFSSEEEKKSSLAYVALRGIRNEIILTMSTSLEANRGYGSIYLPDTLGSAPYQLVAFTNWMRNWDDEHYATRQLLVINRFDDGPGSLIHVADGMNRPLNAPGTPDSCHSAPGGDIPVRIDMPAREFGTREMIPLRLEAELPPGSQISLSVSVVQKESLFRATHDESFIQKQFPSLPGKLQFFRETSGEVISGRVFDRSGEAVADATVLLNTPDTVLNLLYAKTLPGGNFHFLLNPYHEGSELFISLYGQDIPTGAVIDMHDKFSIKRPFEPSVMRVEAGFDRFISASRNIVTVNKVFNKDHNSYYNPQLRGFRPGVYGRPAFYFNRFEYYVHFNDLQDIARELLPILRIRRQRDGHYRSALLLDQPDGPVLGTPAYFLDGIYICDLNRILHLDSRTLNKLEVHNYPWRHGDIMFTGIVALFSGKNEYRNIKFHPSVISMYHPPVSRGASYDPPVYGQDGNNRTETPDFRQLLVWLPVIELDNLNDSRTIEFSTGDIKGEFIVRLRGVAPDGTIINEQTEILIR